MAVSKRPRPRASLAAVPLYKPGKPLQEVQRELGLKHAIKLASNENPLGPSPKAVAALKRGLKELHRYPEGGAPLLKARLAKLFKLPVDHFILGNGSNEVLIFAAEAFAGPGTQVAYSARSFAVYEIATRLANAKPVVVPSPDFSHDLPGLAKAAQKASVVYICNPNNPTGSFHPDAAIEAFLKKVPSKCLVVLDVAYAEFSGHSIATDARWVKRFPNVLITRTFSKAYGLAGLRIGYGVGHPHLIAALEKCRQPFNANSAAQWAALAALDDQAFVRRSQKTNAAGVKQIQRGLADLGLYGLPSKANLVLFTEPDYPAPASLSWYEWLLHGGIVVRPIEKGYLRVSVGLPQENAAFLKRLKEGLS